VAIVALLITLAGIACDKRERPRTDTKGAPLTDDGGVPWLTPGDAPFVTDPTYEEACRQPEKRPAYVSHVLAKVTLPAFVTGVAYLDRAAFSRLAGGRFVSQLGFVTLRDDLAKEPPFEAKVRSRIIVLPGAFDRTRVASEKEFLLGLLAHELVHARVAFAGFREAYLVPRVFRELPAADARWLHDTLTELDAYDNEIATSRHTQLPASFYRVALGRYLEYYLRLIAEPHRLSPALRQRLLLDRFRPWMLRQSAIFEAGAGDDWCFQIEGTRYQLPPAVVAALRAHLPGLDLDASVEDAR